MTAFDTIVAALESHGMRTFTKGGSTRSQCPAHESRGATLSVRQGDGRASVHCFAGCDDTGVLAAIGLAVRDLFDEPRRADQLEDRRTRLPAPTPWEAAMAELGIRNPPSIDHVLHRMEVEALKEGRICGDCLTEASPWSCSCGALKFGGAK